MVLILHRIIRILFQLPMLILGLPPHSCRLTPSCSRYCDQSLSRFGLLKGGAMCIKRIFRCGPWTPAGHDPVPEM